MTILNSVAAIALAALSLFVLGRIFEVHFSFHDRLDEPPPEPDCTEFFDVPRVPKRDKDT